MNNRGDFSSSWFLFRTTIRSSGNSTLSWLFLIFTQRHGLLLDQFNGTSYIGIRDCHTGQRRRCNTAGAVFWANMYYVGSLPLQACFLQNYSLHPWLIAGQSAAHIGTGEVAIFPGVRRVMGPPRFNSQANRTSPALDAGRL